MGSSRELHSWAALPHAMTYVERAPVRAYRPSMQTFCHIKASKDFFGASWAIFEGYQSVLASLFSYSARWHIAVCEKTAGFEGNGVRKKKLKILWKSTYNRCNMFSREEKVLLWSIYFGALRSRTLRCYPAINRIFGTVLHKFVTILCWLLRKTVIRAPAVSAWVSSRHFRSSPMSRKGLVLKMASHLNEIELNTSYGQYSMFATASVFRESSGIHSVHTAHCNTRTKK